MLENTDRSPSPNRRRVLTATGVALVAAACEPERPSTPPPTSPPKPPTTTRPPTTSAPTTTASTTTVPNTTTPSTTAGTSTTTTVPGVAETLTPELLIDKLTYGPTPGLREHIETVGMQPWLESQLDPEGSGVATAEHLLSSFETLTNNVYENRLVADTGSRLLDHELDYATILRARFSEAQLFEQMCDFWSNHFNVWRNQNWLRYAVNTYSETVIRPNALGNFETLLLATAHSTAMLTYLDNAASDGNGPGGPSENYARELMELHTLGIIDGQQAYSEADVAGVAKILSGWGLKGGSMDDDLYTFTFHADAHNTDAVSLFDGAHSRPQREVGEGYEDGVALLRYLAHHPSTATYVALKLCRRFVSDAPTDELVASTAEVFTASDLEIAPTLRHIFGTDEFAASHRAKARRPFDQVIATMRAIDLGLAANPSGDTAFGLFDALERMGQRINERHSPDGFPDHEGYWVSSEGLLQRWRFAALASRDVGLADVTVDNAALLPSPVPATAGALLVDLAHRLCGIPMSSPEASSLLAALGLNGNGPSSQITGSEDTLDQIVGLILSHPTFQRR